MLHILLVILKFIGILVACLLLLLLAAILAMLFVPVRYRLDGKKYPDQMSGTAKLSWLLHLITVRAEYNDGKLGVKLRILGFPKTIYPFVKRSSPSVAEEELLEDQEDLADEQSVCSTEIAELEETEEIEETTETADVVAMSIPEEPEGEKQTISAKKEEKESFWTKAKEIPKRIRAFWGNVKSFFKRLVRLKKTIWEKLELIRADETKDVYKRFKKHLLYLWKHTGPRKIKGLFRFGFDDPSLTGMAAGVIYFLLPRKCYEVELYPEFDRVIIEGELLIKGRIRVWHIAKVGWQVFWDKEFRKLLKNMKI